MSVTPTPQEGHPVTAHLVHVDLRVPPPALPYEGPSHWAVEQTVKDLIAEGAISTDQAITFYMNRALAAHAEGAGSFTVVGHLDAVQALLYPEPIAAPFPAEETP